MQFDKIESFVLSLFQNKGGSVSKQEILNKSQQADLSSDDRSIFDDLPDRSFNKDDLLKTLKSVAGKQGVSKIGRMFKKAA